MNKQNLYVALFNVFAGVLASFLLKDNILFCVLGIIVVITIVFIERKRIFEKIFRKNKRYAAIGYSFLVLVMIIGFFLLTQPGRDTSQIIRTVDVFLSEIKSENYGKAWDKLSSNSKSSYPLEDFVRDHSNHRTKIDDFQIDEVIFNKYDGNRAEAVVSSSSSLYGRRKLQLKMIKEENNWQIVFNKEIIKKSAPFKTKKGIISGLIRKIF